MENVQNYTNVNEQSSNEETITSLEDLKRYAEGTVVRLPDFGSGQPFVARMRRPSMLALVKSGQIPNTLLTTANEMFNGNKKDTDDEDLMMNMFSVMEVICDAALIEPTYSQIKEAGMELSDDQILAIFNYTQVGVKALDNFREK